MNQALIDVKHCSVSKIFSGYFSSTTKMNVTINSREISWQTAELHKVRRILVKCLFSVHIVKR